MWRTCRPSITARCGTATAPTSPTTSTPLTNTTNRARRTATAIPVANATISIAGIRAIYGSVLGEIEEYSGYAGMIESIGTFSELPDNEEYILSQYDLVAGEYPEQNERDQARAGAQLGQRGDRPHARAVRLRFRA